MRTRTKLAAVVAGAFLAGGIAAVPAMASSPCSGTHPTCGVNGVVTLVTTTTMSLDQTSFSINGAPGAGVSAGGTGSVSPGGAANLYTVPTAYPVNATITTNAGNYSIAETLSEGGSNGNAGFSNPGGFYLGSANVNSSSALTYAWSYAANAGPASAGAFSQSWTSGTPAGATSLVVASMNANSAPTGDTYGLSWGWNVPAAQPITGTYTGTISVIGM